MFDPLSGFLTMLVTEGLKKLTGFLHAHGFPLEVDSWGSLFVAAVVAALIAFANLQGGKLPDSLQALVPYVIQTFLIWIQAIGFHAALKRVSRMVG